MADKVTGFLEVGLNEKNEIVVNVPETAEDKAHHVVFSSNQARNLAALLVKKADEADATVGRSRN